MDEIIRNNKYSFTYLLVILPIASLMGGAYVEAKQLDLISTERNKLIQPMMVEKRERIEVVSED